MRDVWKPSVTVAGVIERDAKYLLVEEEIEGRVVFNQPAGHWEPGESLLEACVREVLEETAHRFRPTELVGIYRWHFAPADVTFLRFAYTGVVEGVEDRPLDREIRRAVWLAYDEVLAVQSRHRSPLVMACIDDHRAGKRYPLETIVHYE
jgi:ADP-ribose pyrophosphatase YjhB (NUDIX family)